MPFDMKTKKTLDESEKAQNAAKGSEATKKHAMVVAGADMKEQENSLKPKDAAPPAQASDKKESQNAQAAKKEAPKKTPPEPAQVAEKAAEKKDDSKDYWAVREVVAASHNAAKLDETKIKQWIRTAESLMERVDFSSDVDLRASIGRFTEALEALKQPKGLKPDILNGFLKNVEAAPKMTQDAVKALTAEGEKLLKAANKTQADQVQEGIDKLNKLGGANQ